MNSRSNIAGLNSLKQAAEFAIRRTPKTQIGHQRGRSRVDSALASAVNALQVV